MADGGRSGATTLTHLWAADLLTIPTLTCKTLHVLVFIAHGRRKLMHVNVTTSPTTAWVWRQVIDAAGEVGRTSEFVPGASGQASIGVG